MELKVGKRYLIVKDFINNHIDAALEIGVDFDSEKVGEVISEIVVDEISISGEYVKFNSFVGFPVNVNQWNRIDSIRILEELPDKKIKDGGVTQDNIYEKLIEMLTKTLDKKINKRKVGKERKCVKSGFEKHKK